MNRLTLLGRSALLLACCTPAIAAAQEGEDAPRRTRVALGPGLASSYPGADSVSLRPFFDFSRVRGDDPFAFEAPDESFGFTVFNNGALAIGPSLGFEGKRRARDAGGLPSVGSTVEVGGFVQFQLAEPIRVRAELRQGIGGHKGLVADFSGDYVVRDADRWLVSVGPRVTLASNRYHDAYFSAAPVDAAAAGIRPYDADGGLQSVGATVGGLYQLTPRWGVQAYARYDRLVADPADSPIVRAFGSRNQFSSGIAATYTFGRGVR